MLCSIEYIINILYSYLVCLCRHLHTYQLQRRQKYTQTLTTEHPAEDGEDMKYVPPQRTLNNDFSGKQTKVWRLEPTEDEKTRNILKYNTDNGKEDKYITKKYINIKKKEKKRKNKERK